MEMKATITATGPIFSGKTQDVINDQMTAFLYEATTFLERMVRAATPLGVGGTHGSGLRQTEYGEVQGKGTPIQKGIVAHQSVYGDVVEKGRTANKAMPPKGTLIQWMQLKMGIGEDEAKKLEFVVRRSIGKKGFAGAHMFEHTWEKYFPQIEQMAQSYGLTIARQLNG
jgi:hypothetical protein